MSELFVDNISNQAGTSAMTIDTNGVVATPARPAFSVYRDSSGTEGVGGNVTFTGVHANIGSHYSTSTGLFTAPVAGFYQFNLVAFGSNSTGGVVATGQPVVAQLYDVTNSSALSIGYSYVNTVSHPNMSFSSAHKLNANDQVRIYVSSQYLYSDVSDQYLKFSGFFIG